MIQFPRQPIVFIIWPVCLQRQRQRHLTCFILIVWCREQFLLLSGVTFVRGLLNDNETKHIFSIRWDWNEDWDQPRCSHRHKQTQAEEAPEYPRLLKVLLLSSLFLAVAHCRGIIQMQAGSRPLQVLAKHLCGTASPHSCWKYPSANQNSKVWFSIFPLNFCQ